MKNEVPCIKISYEAEVTSNTEENARKKAVELLRDIVESRDLVDSAKVKMRWNNEE